MSTGKWSAASKAKYRATRAATIARNEAEKNRANMVAVHSIPIESIPDDKPTKKYKKIKGALKPSTATTKEQAVLEIIRLTMWLAQN